MLGRARPGWGWPVGAKTPGALDCFIPLCFATFYPKYPKKIPGALRAPDYFIPLCFCCFFTQNTPKIPARFARRIASFPHVFAPF
jgi:hypothetical protein